MLCPACQKSMTGLALAGQLVRQSCPTCGVHIVESLDGSVYSEDLLDLLMGVVREQRQKGGLDDRGSAQ